jgi:hypothetical protein
MGIKNKTCIFDDKCIKQPSYGFQSDKLPTYCVSHALNGMYNIRRKRCEYIGCTVVASYRYSGSIKTLTRCSTHAVQGMIRPSGKCKHIGCDTRASFGLLQNGKVGKREFCVNHKYTDMVSHNPTCKFDGCHTRPSFAYCTDSSPMYCFSHSLDRMVNIVNSKCKVIDCTIQSSYGYPNIPKPPTTHCHKHALHGMIPKYKIVCIAANCNHWRSCSVYSDICTEFCVTCAIIHDKDWYILRLFANKCNAIECNTQKCRYEYDGKGTNYCISCAKIQDAVWYSMHVSHSQCGNIECLQQKTSSTYGNRSTKFCVTCTKKYDPEWYMVYKQKVQCNFEHCLSQKRTPSLFCKIHQFGYIRPTRMYSMISCQFMDTFARLNNVNVQHKHYSDHIIDGNEHSICNYSVDGWIQESKTVIEFHGDYWHGNPTKYDADDYNKVTHTTFGELYDKTMNRMHKIHRLGYIVLYVWESDFRAWTPDNPLPVNTFV